MVLDNNYIPILKQMLHDIDTSVIANVIYVLEELELSRGGMEVTTPLIMHLLNKISDFSEWGLSLLLNLVTRYTPTSEDEVFAIMNILDPVLRISNSGVVLSTIKCFLVLTESLPDLQPQVIARAKPPMLTLITGGCSEVQYSVLKHLQILIPRPSARGIFDEDFRQFFVRYNEPTYVKHLKVDLLPYIANSSNVRDIASELGEYVTDVDAELSRRAICAMGDIAINLPDMSNEIVSRIVELIDLDMGYVRVEAIKATGKVLRVFPEMRAHIIPSISRYLKLCDDPEARTVLIWILGEFGQEIIEAPYLLEPIIDNYGELDSPSMKLQILSASVKLFFKRPPEMQAMLGRLFSKAINDTTTQDVHDRALLYYRLFTTNVSIAKEVVDTCGSVSKSSRDGDANSHFSEEISEETRNQIFSEFNTLSVIYGKPSIQFINFKYYQVIHRILLIILIFVTVFVIHRYILTLCIGRILRGCLQSLVNPNRMYRLNNNLSKHKPQTKAMLQWLLSYL
jgi:AP-4 complex subunit beta-1